MKKVFALLSAPLMLAALLTSCKPEQSELNLEALPGSATITGKVEYNPGVTNIDGVLVKDYKKPAEGRTVEVKVFTESYTNASEEALSGNYRTFRATTDEKGRYSVTVPVGFQAITAYVTALPFIDEVNVLDHNKNIIPLENAVYKDIEGVFGKDVSISDQSIEEVDILMVTDKEEADFELNQKVSLKGRVLIPAEVKSEDGLTDTLVPYATELRIRVAVGEKTVIRYDAVADAKGQYSLDMLLPNNCWDEPTTITVERQRTIGDFTHYYRKNGTTNWRSENVQIFVEGEVAATLTDAHKLIPVTMSDLNLNITPIYPEKIHGIGNDIDTEEDIEQGNNPMGWGR